MYFGYSGPDEKNKFLYEREVYNDDVVKVIRE